jgi:hypothetical protein
VNDQKDDESSSFWLGTLEFLKKMPKELRDLSLGYIGVCMALRAILYWNTDVAKQLAAGTFKTLLTVTLLTSEPLNIFMIYGVSVLCLRELIPGTRIEMSVDSFFAWLGKCLQKYLILFVTIAFMMGGVAAAYFGKISIQSRPLASIGIALVVLASALALYFAAFRLSLVTPLALLRRKPVIKGSWVMTKGKFWRIFGNFLLLLLIIGISNGALYLGALSIEKANADMPFFGTTLGASKFLSNIAQGLWQGLSTIVFSVYCCVTYRILSQGQDNNLVNLS